MELDCLLSAEKVVGDFLHSCLSLEPFGRGNPVPLFGVEDCKIEGARLLGKNMSHLELLVDAGDTLRFIWFGAGERAVDVCFPGKCDVAFTPAKNMYNGQETVSLQVRDVRPAPVSYTHLLLKEYDWSKAPPKDDCERRMNSKKHPKS